MILSSALLFSPQVVDASNVGLIENSTWGQNLTAVRFSANPTGDVDNDGDLDLALIGCLSGAGGNDCDNGVVAKIYVNNGTSLVENSTWQGNLTAVGYGSLAWADMDNDNDLDLALSGCTNGTNWNCNGDKILKIYINNGTSLVENSTWQGNLTAVYDSSMTFGDVDNDGDLDLALNGRMTANPFYISRIYINNGTSFVENSTWQQNLIGVYEGQLSFGDIDNDNDLDLALTGDAGSSDETMKIYINNGTSLVENSTWQSDLTAMDQSSLMFGDYDNDGDLDLFACGNLAGDYCFLYQNNGSSLIENQTRSMILNGLIGIYRAATTFGDYDNDGDLDLAAIGNEHGYARVYENNESNNYYFEQDSTAHADISNDIYQGSLEWSDIDNDDDLDLVITALDFATTTVSKIYINNITTANTVPNASASFNTSFSNERLVMEWGAGADAETSALGLYYNLRVGTASGGNNVVSGVYGGSGGGSGGGGGASGYFGNMMQRKTISIKGLSPSTTYYWSVQTIDTALANGSWSAEQSYTTEANIVDPVVTLNSPANYYNTTNATITFNINATDDSGLSNVTLYGNWSGWHVNETNETNLINGTYLFSKNISSFGDGVYIWMIRACDTYNNCESSKNRTFMIDTDEPKISLTSPASGSGWTSANAVSFNYSVSDLDVRNCSLIIDDAVDQTDTSITVSTSQTFSKSLDNDDYTWSVNCTDYVGYENNSETRSLSVSYISPSTDSGVHSGGTTGTPVAASETKSIKNLGVGESATVSFTKDIGVESITVTAAETISSMVVTASESSKPATAVTPNGEVYKYFDISSNIEVERAVIRFKVEKSWLNTLDYSGDDIVLKKFTEKWESLETKRVNADDLNYYYSAESKGFSTFVITAEKKGSIDIKEPTEEAEEVGELVEEERGLSYKIWLVIVVIVIVNGYIVYRYLRRRMK